jgi:hypothetical protein
MENTITGGSNIGFIDLVNGQWLWRRQGIRIDDWDPVWPSIRIFTE